MITNYKTIKIKRNSSPLDSKEEAMVFLNRTKHLQGQPVLATYKTSTYDIETIFVLGTKEGIGPDCYRIISAAGLQVIYGIITAESQLPDSTTLVNGQTYVYIDPSDNELFWIYLDKTSRVDTPIDPDVYYRVFNLTDDAEYWIYDGEISKTNNYYSREKINEILLTLKTQIGSNINSVSEDLSSFKTTIKEVLGITGDDFTYPGGISGATSFDSADKLLNTKIIRVSDSLNNLGDRVNLLEKEFLTSDEGLSETTRLDEVYSWYDQVTHTPSSSIEFRKVDTDPLVMGTTHTYTVTFKWSWAGKLGYTGIRLGDTEYSFGTSEIPGASGNDNKYEWQFTWSIPISESSVTQEWEANFIGSEESPVVYSQTALTPKRSINIGFPQEDSWKSSDQSFQVPVVFSGSNLPESWEGVEMWVKEDDYTSYTGNETKNATQSITYNANLVTSKEVTISAGWGTTAVSKIFKPCIFSVIHEGYDINTESISEGNIMFSFSLDNNLELPAITYLSGDILVIMSPITFTESFTAYSRYLTQNWVDVTEDFENIGTLVYNDITYSCIAFKNIGAGTFNFKIQQ